VCPNCLRGSHQTGESCANCGNDDLVQVGIPSFTSSDLDRLPKVDPVGGRRIIDWVEGLRQGETEPIIEISLAEYASIGARPGLSRHLRAVDHLSRSDQQFEFERLRRDLKRPNGRIGQLLFDDGNWSKKVAVTPAELLDALA
jgi:hypothetical protein